MIRNRRWMAFAAAFVALVALTVACGGPVERTGGATPAAPMTVSPSPSPSPGEAPASPDGDETASPAEPSEPSDRATEIEIEVEDGQVTGPGRVRVTQGEPVRLRVSSDTADEVHVHGYDILANVAPGRPALITFRAKIAGIFEVELEGAHLLLLRLEVSP